MDSFLSVENISRGEYRVKGSKFLSYLYPANTESECKEQLEALRNQHNKANHHCYGFHLKNKFLLRFSDDGEPSGSAGRPIMGVIEKNELLNVHLVVVRYFGGIKLGVRGLIDAYSGAAEMAVQSAKVKKQYILKELQVELDYSALGFIERFVQQNKLPLLDASFQAKVRQVIGITPSKYELVRRKLQEEIKQEFGSLDQALYPIRIITN
ncbi:MAG TPA: YigZ family protein [Saprospiraceae bacterium]|nr:YigZ family protein [Saprospiraceae bacterium]